MKKYLFSILILILLFFAVTVYADDNGYIVKMPENRGVTLMSAMPENAEYYGNGIYVVDSYDEALALSGYAEYIEPNHTVYLHSTYNYTTLAKNNYILSAVNIQSLWHYGCYGNDVLVGVIDTGCNPHRLLEGAVVEGRNFLAKDGEDITDVTDNIGHGTLVAGLIAARYGSTQAIGMAHHAKVMPIKIFDGTTSTDAIVSQAIYYAADNGCRIINMSLGSSDYSGTMKNAIDYAVEKGVIFVASVGNNAEGTENPDLPNYLSYPAAFDCVIGVGAIDSNLTRASFSHHNESVFVMAPGVSVKGTYYLNDNIAAGKGTSFASPIVSGIIADMLSIDDKLTLDEIKETIIETSNRDKGFSGNEIWNEYYGYGVVDAGAIANYMLSDKDWFASPIDRLTEIPEITVYKNNDYDYSPVAIAKKSDGTYITKEVNFSGRGVVVLKYATEPNNPNFKLWKDMKSIMPLVKQR